MAADAFFMPAGNGHGGQRFCLYHAPSVSTSVSASASAPRAAVVYVHPFAEEMNKSRRMAALQSRAFAQAGCAVLQIDLLGCGDSSGNFADASWDAWVADVLLACQWLRARTGAPLWLWGLRAGCLIAADAARRSHETCNLLLWQPATSGKAVLQQFIRLKTAGNMLSGKAAGMVQDVRADLARGQGVEIAGYVLSPGLAEDMERATLGPVAGLALSPAPTPRARRLELFEISNRPDPALSPASSAAAALWRVAGWATRAQVVQGPAFWQTSEIEEAPQLIAATTTALQQPVDV